MENEQNEVVPVETFHTEPPQEEMKQNETENCIIRFLADRHADDEHALEVMNEKLSGLGEIPDEALELFYQGINYDRDLEKARQESYLKGRNENIECTIREQNESMPVDDGGLPEMEESPILNFIRPSIWDD